MCDDEKSSSPKSSSNNKGANAVSVAVLIAGMGLAVASAALMATASQCTIYAEPGARPRTVTYRDYAPFVYVYTREHLYATLAVPLYTP
jgi:predicted membrane protein